MAPVMKNITPHFSHVHSNHACVVDTHVYCTDCPRQLSSFLHNHTLFLILKPDHHHHHRTICDICRESIDGVFYGCSHCGFHVHPFCTQLPEKLRHVIDDHHTLRLHKPPFGSCGVCRIDCSSLWVYGCDICRVNIHLNWLRKPYGSKGSSTSRGSRGIPHAPPPFGSTMFSLVGNIAAGAIIGFLFGSISF